jgi:hypothetical protein
MSDRRTPMAQKHPDEDALYAKIKEENIKVHPYIWDMIYLYLGDEISAVTQIVFTSCHYQELLPVEDAKKILNHTKTIKIVLGQILHPEKIRDGHRDFQKIKNEDMTLDPVVNELFTHYIGNDVNAINMILGFYLDPKDEQPCPVDHAKKIFDKTQTMTQFLNKLREATHQEAVIPKDREQ